MASCTMTKGFRALWGTLGEVVWWSQVDQAIGLWLCCPLGAYYPLKGALLLTEAVLRPGNRGTSVERGCGVLMGQGSLPEGSIWEF